MLFTCAARDKAIGYGHENLDVIVATILLALSPTPNAQNEALAFWFVVVLTEERCSGWWEVTLGLFDAAFYACCCG